VSYARSHLWDSLLIEVSRTNTCRNTGRGHCELASLSARIRQTKTHLQSESRENAAFLILLRYLDALDEFTRSSSHALQPHSQSRPSVGEHQEAPDSAIEMSDDDGKAFLSKSPRNTAAARRLEMAGFLDELSEMPSQVPSQAPVPPPKSRARASSIGLGPGALNGRQLHSAVRAETAPVPGRYEHRRGWSFSGVGPSQTYSGRDVQGQSPVEIRIQPPTTTPAAVSLWRPTWEDQPSSARPSTSGSGLSINQPRQNSFPQIKRSNSRLASAFRSLSLRRKSSPPPPAPTMEFPTAVFGVPLAESILVARGLAGTQHSGGGRSSREYPLCVLRCVYFLRSSPPSSSSSSLSVSSGGGNSSGISTPDIFGQDIRILDPNTEVSLAKLKEIFNSPASLYGKILDWTPFTAHDAANLILLYLSELPTPLIPLSIARRWVVLSRQSTIRGSLSTRLDQGLDFWEEAFSGVYGPSRALFKLLLNLWGEVVQVAYVNDMTAERLAQNLMGPLLHLRREGEVQGSEYTDVLLGLAFIIRKRQEYNLALGGRSAPV